MEPRIVVNAKAYPEVIGAGLLRLAKAAEDAGRAHGERIGLAVPATLIASVAEARLEHVVVLAQHADAHPPGAVTGWLPVEALQAAGAEGSLVNHAEHKVPDAQTQATVERLRGLRMLSLVCADGRDELQRLAPFRPTMLAVEPPQLIGGDVSVTKADPAIVRDAVEDTRRLAPATLPLCGAGVKGAEDFAAALALGAHGVLLASGVVKARDPKLVLMGMLDAARSA